MKLIFNKHFAIRMFTCELCKSSFPRKDNLNRHKKIHEDKQCSCSFCDKTFSRVDTLRRHYFSKHSDDKPSFICDKCLKIFDRKHNLVRHMQTHS